MKFLIGKASDWHGDNKPCSKAIKIGKNKYDNNVWEVELNTLDDILALMNECDKDLVIGESYYDDEHKYEITIYDDYME